MVAQTHFMPPTIIIKKNKFRSHSLFLQNISDVPALEQDMRRNEVQNKGVCTLEPAAVTNDHRTVLSLAQVWILVFIHDEQKVSKEENPKNISCGNDQHHVPGASISGGSRTQNL